MDPWWQTMDKLEAHTANGLSVRTVVFRFLKASAKTALIYVVFHLLTAFMLPLKELYTYSTSLPMFFAVFLAFMFLIELTKGTVYHHIFSIANALFVVFYLARISNTGTIRLSVERIVMTIDLSFFLAVFLLGGVIGFAKSLLHLLGWMNEREQRGLE